METSVTKPLEEIINTVSGIDELRSTTKEGISQITVQFFLEKNRDVAAQEVRDKISTILATTARRHRPADHRQVRPQRHAGDDDRRVRPAGRCRRSPRSPANASRRTWRACRGVGAVILVGGRQRAVNVYVDTDKLTAYHLSIEDVRQALIAAEPGVARRPRRPGAAGAGAADHGPRRERRRLPRADRRQPERLSRCGSRTSAAWRTRSRSPAGWPGSTATTPSA